MRLIKSLAVAAIATGAAGIAQAQVVGVATNPQGSLYYSVGSALAQVMQQKGGVTARVQPMSGSSAYAPLINRGQIEFGLLNALDVVNAYKGVENFKGRKNPDLRLVGVMFSLPIGMAVPNDSPAKTIADLKGLRVPSQFTAQSTIRAVQDAVLATGGLKTADMKQYPVPDYVKGMTALGEGKVDTALFGPGTAASQQVQVELASRGGLRFLPITTTPQALAAMRKVFPSAYPTVLQPSSAMPGIIGPTTLMGYSAFLVSSSKVPEDVVYKAAKAIYGNKEALVAASATMRRFDPKEMSEDSAVPYHAGAEKLFKEVGAWPPKKK